MVATWSFDRAPALRARVATCVFSLALARLLAVAFRWLQVMAQVQCSSQVAMQLRASQAVL
jgi:hypothetical protein